MRVAASLIGLLLAFAPTSCEEYGPRVYMARPVVAGLACLPPSVPLGVVQAGDLPSTCPPRCVLLDAALYVSPVCPPLPARAIELQPDRSPACARALALFDMRAFCGELDAGALDAGPFDANSLDAAELGGARLAP